MLTTKQQSISLDPCVAGGKKENAPCLLLKQFTDEMLNTTTAMDSETSPRPFQEEKNKSRQID